MSETFTYEKAGVSIDSGNKLVSKLKDIVKKTHRKGVLGSLGGFGGCFELPLERYRQPVLVSSTDGVGTKLRLAIDLNQHEFIGIDLVAMCVNDLIVMGAEPLFFLDYFATGHLQVEVAEKVISSIAEGCIQANVALIGGETAEMPGHYQAEDYDLAGFTVGIVEKNQIIDGSTIVPGDVLIGLPSSGLHANGFSLARAIINTKQIPLHQKIGSQTLATLLLTPTRIYVKSLLKLIEKQIVKGAVHITGGGFIDNIPRVLPSHCAATIDLQSWEIPPIFQFLQKEGNVSSFEMRRTFNCGVGMILCVSPDQVETTLSDLSHEGEKAWVLGTVIERQPNEAEVQFINE